MQPLAKRRRLASAALEEIKFDPAARQEYLTGFHKRKLQRAKQAHEAAEKKARLERLEERRKLREERKADLERHVEDINALLRPLQNLEGSEESQSETESAGANSWEGISAPPKVDREAEYVDEGRYTTVTVEAMEVSREGLHKADDNGQRNDAGGRNRQGDRAANEGDNRDEKRKWTREKPKDKADRPKKKNKKFRYESKGERKLARVKQKLRNKKQASARRAA